MAKFNRHLSNLVAFIRLNLLVKIDLQLWLDKPFDEVETPEIKNIYRGAFLKFMNYVSLSQCFG